MAAVIAPPSFSNLSWLTTLTKTPALPETKQVLRTPELTEVPGRPEVTLVSSNPEAKPVPRVLKSQKQCRHP